jgi:3-deoxy-D-manno-octulosonate 8-phosphate phosphatase KdsC-like HAD superfamily phosphatase
MDEFEASSGPSVKDDKRSPAEIIALELKKISRGMQQILQGGLKKEAVIILLAAKTKLSKRDIECVLDGMRDLAADWTN